jgi:rod shape-determining protein MreB
VFGVFGVFRQFAYVQLSSALLTVRDPKSGQSISEGPEIAVREGAESVVLAIGNQARMAAAEASVRVSNPFLHPRTLLADFTLADQILKTFLRRLRPNRLLRPSPLAVMHPLGEFEGGLTQIEVRALQGLGDSAGAYKTIVWQGPTLTDEQVLSQSFPTTGRVLVG